MLEETAADTVVSVLPVPAEYNPHWVFFQADDGSLYLSTGERTPIARRQDLPPAFHRDGSLYVTKRDVVMESNTMYGNRTIGYVVASDDSVNIDDLADWDRAETKLAGSR